MSYYTALNPPSLCIVLLKGIHSLVILTVSVINFGCSGSNPITRFSDSATLSAETCLVKDPGLYGTYTPVDPLSTFVGKPAGGLWTLGMAGYSLVLPCTDL